MNGVAAANSPPSARAGHAAYYFGSRFGFSEGQKARTLSTVSFGVRHLLVVPCAGICDAHQGLASLPLSLVHGHGREESKRASYCILVVDAVNNCVASF
jgi:hypothetical protein